MGSSRGPPGNLTGIRWGAWGLLAPFQGTFVQGSTRRAHIEVKSSAREGARVEIGGAVLRVASGTWAALPG